MKKNTLFRGWLGVAMLFIQTTQIFCQVREPFNELDLSAISSHYFYPQTFKDISVPDPYSFENPINGSTASTLFKYFDVACLDEHLYIDDFAEFRRSIMRTAAIENCVPLAVLDITYHDFAASVMSNLLILYENEKFHDAPIQSSSPYVEKDALILWVGSNSYKNEIVKFKLSEDNYITNRGDYPSSIQIDFDDGLGFREVAFGDIIAVDYTSGNQDRNVRMKSNRLSTGDLKSVSITTFDVSFDPCINSPFPNPTIAPWPTDEPITSDWTISAEYGSGTVSGNAYTLTSEDGIFDKPFIFVEGVDFGTDNDLTYIQSQYQNGTFGWCQFSSGFVDPNPNDIIEYGYDMLHLMPEFLNTIREYGYDIVLVDFWDGADYMEKNSALLQHVIRLCNEYKIGKEMLIVAGASMGGQVSRHALRSMELNGEDACARVWISLDSPHAGANIPAALQQAIKFGTETGSIGAENFRDFFLERPAAEELLNYSAFQHIAMHDNWYNLINNMGYPEKCRTVAISNGRGDGVGLYYPHPRLMDWECEILNQGPKQFLFNNVGDAILPFGGQNQLCHLRTVVTGSNAIGNDWLAFVFGPIVGAVANYIDTEERIVQTPQGQYNWDYAPGGTRRSLKSYADAVNHAVADSPLSDVCNEVDNSEYNDAHCFVSATSAVGISGINPYVNIRDHIESNLQDKKFDRIEFAQDHNEMHSELTPYNMSVILEEILGPELSGLGIELTANSQNAGNFNYGKEQFAWLRDIHIHNGGHLSVNKNIPTHFNGSNDLITLPYLFEVSTSACSPAIVEIDHLGSLEIGDQYASGKNAELVLDRDSKIIVSQGGTLKVFRESRIIINEGAELIIYPDADVAIDNGSIVVNAGGKIIFKAGLFAGTVNDITLLNDNASIVLNGGQIVVEDNTIFYVDHAQGPSGFIQINTGTENALVNGDNSEFSLTGDDDNDVMLVINDYAHLQNSNWHQGEIKLERCRVNLNNHGAILTDMKFTSKYVRYVDDDSYHQDEEAGAVQVYDNISTIVGCKFDAVRFYNRQGQCQIKTSTFQGTPSGFVSLGGGFTINGSDFTGCHIESEGLQTVSTISSTDFQYGNHSHVIDESLVDIQVKGCNFENYYYVPAIHKTGGKLSVFCSNFNTSIGLKVTDGELNLSSTDMAGYNLFSNSTIGIQLTNATDINLYKGHNNFSNISSYFIEGTMNFPCLKSQDCSVMFDALSNFWGYYGANSPQPTLNLLPPLPDKFDVHTSYVWPCAGYENPNACEIKFSDIAPMLNNGCPVRVKPEVKSVIFSDDLITEMDVPFNGGHGILKDYVIDANTPIINTTHFENTPLDSALIFAAMQMEAYDSLANDAFAVVLFHEILLDSLDQTNSEVKRKMNWGRYNMKTAMEAMFVSGELTKENNQEFFESPVEKYVEILNLMTETELTDSTYQLQFYLELDKGQLFRTIGKPNITQQVFAHLNDCQLDSLEQVVLNNWLEQVEIEISLDNQYYNLQVPIDSLSEFVDTSGYTLPVTLESSDYYFGLWIDSPNSVTFVSCGSNPVYRWAKEEKGNFLIFPNPSNQQIFIRGLKPNTSYAITLLDMGGSLLSAIKLPASIGSGDAQISLPLILSNGNYILRIISDELIEDHPLLINR